ncbi:MAG: response regulator [Acidobacteria bacterium]|nr:response regulator [Acidobacteriota bacterium]
MPLTRARIPAAGAALFLWLSCVRGETPQYSFEYYGQEHGLASSLVRCLTQDKKGFLWVGTPIGLFRWDGFRFRRYAKSEGLPDISIRAVFVDPQGTLWAGTPKGIVRLEGNHFRTGSATDVDIFSRTAFTSDKKGNVYVGSRSGIYVSRSNGQFTKLSIAGNVDRSAIPGLWADEDSSLWFGCGDGICRWGEGGLARFGAGDGVPKDIYGSFVRDGRGHLYVRGLTGIVVQEKGQRAFRRELTLSGEGSMQIMMGSRGRLYAPSWNGLWVRGLTGEWTQVTEDNGLPANRINAVWEDKEQSLWLGFSDFGIARWRGKGDWEGWTRASGLPSSAVSAILRGSDGRLWIGTRAGLAVFQGESGPFVPLRGIGAAPIRAIAETPDGSVWVGAYEDGLWRVRPNSTSAERIGPERGIELRQLLNLYSASDGWLYAASRQGVYRTRATGPPQFERVWEKALLPGEQIYAIREDHAGRLWLAGTRGVLQMQAGGQFRRFDQKDGLLDRTVVLLTFGGANEVWLGYGRYMGLTRMRMGAKPELKHFDASTVLASNDLCFLAGDERGWIWVGTDNGVDVFNGKDWRHIGTRDGLIWHDTVFQAFHAERDGHVWIGTNRGLSRFLPRDEMFHRPPPSIAITGVSAGGKAVDENTRIKTPYENRLMRVGFSTLSFTQAGSVRFRYRLNGLDGHWNETLEREAVFPSLVPGEYEFEVQAGSKVGWNPESARVHFAILAPWWRSYWFTAGVVLCLLGLAYGLHRHRVRRIQRKRAELELAVTERTIELQREKNRTEREKQTVEQQKREIEHLLEQAREVARLKDEFLANVSHEIRTPMNGILGMTSLALQTALRPDQREFLECARSSGEALLSLLNDILDFSKIEANRLELETVSFSPRNLVEDCVRSVRPAIGNKNIRLEWNVEAGVPAMVQGDPTRVRQVLLNLLSNAVKFTSEGFVSVRLSVDAVEEDRTELLFRVIDTGEGIAPEKHKVIFEAFRQADGSTTRRFGGTGLGLAICDRLVQLMGGEIRVESELGRGSEFSFCLPFLTGVAAAPPAKPTPGELGRLALALEGREQVKVLRVLVAEDNPINQKLVVRMLERQGHEVEVAGDGKQAYMLTGHKHYDLVLMDVQMPELDGLQATRLIREREAKTGGRLPILMLTANAMPGDKEKCIEAGANAYLAKPVSFDKLTSIVLELTSVSS